MATGWSVLESVDPSSLPLIADGTHVDLSQLPPNVQQGLLDALDSDHDGYLTPPELSAFMTSLDMPNVDRQLLQRFDTDGDGIVDDAEVLALLPPSLQSSSIRLDDLPPQLASQLLLASSSIGLGHARSTHQTSFASFSRMHAYAHEGVL